MEEYVATAVTHTRHAVFLLDMPLRLPSFPFLVGWWLHVVSRWFMGGTGRRGVSLPTMRRRPDDACDDDTNERTYGGVGVTDASVTGIAVCPGIAVYPRIRGRFPDTVSSDTRITLIRGYMSARTLLCEHAARGITTCCFIYVYGYNHDGSNASTSVSATRLTIAKWLIISGEAVPRSTFPYSSVGGLDASGPTPQQGTSSTSSSAAVRREDAATAA